jgi:serine/threonine protein kinase
VIVQRYVTHPNIVQVLDWFKSPSKANQPQKYYIVKEFMEGGSLMKKINDLDQLSEDQTKLIVR